MKGIVLAGGKGTRLYPSTKVITKSLIPIYDKPMIYYPLSTLMLAGIREVLIITTREDNRNFQNLIGDGTQLGMKIDYAMQIAPNGIAEAMIIAQSYLNEEPCCLILGDNIFYGHDLPRDLRKAAELTTGAHVFVYQVNDPERYGVIQLVDGRPYKLEEKPKEAFSNLAVTGIYFYDGNASKYAWELKPSPRGEIEITDLTRIYLKANQLEVTIMGRGTAWLDTGTHESMLEASQFIEVIERRQGLKIACLEEIAWRQEWITSEHLRVLANKYRASTYGMYLMKLLEER